MYIIFTRGYLKYCDFIRVFNVANVRNGNTYYVDSTGSLDIKNIKISSIYLTSTGASARIVLSDSSTGATKIDLRIAASGESKLFESENASIVFPNGITITTLSNAVATLLLEESQK